MQLCAEDSGAVTQGHRRLSFGGCAWTVYFSHPLHLTCLVLPALISRKHTSPDIACQVATTTGEKSRDNACSPVSVGYRMEPAKIPGLHDAFAAGLKAPSLEAECSSES